jgi:hypothetical protein
MAGEMPAAVRRQGQHARRRDLWVLAASGSLRETRMSQDGTMEHSALAFIAAEPRRRLNIFLPCRMLTCRGGTQVGGSKRRIVCWSPPL